jgi:chromosome segregation ATPase
LDLSEAQPEASAAAESATVAAVAASRDQELEEELKIAREQLQQASEAFAFLETRVKDGPGGQASSGDIEVATGRITELELALKRAEEEAADARNGSVSQEELDRVKRDADERVAELERQMQEGAAKVDPEMEALRAQLAEAEARAKGAEDALASARADVAAAREEVETAPPNDHVSDGLLEELEAKVAEAEARAKEAEEEALRLTPEANDLRARLAQAAARKKLGPSG